MHGQQKQPVQHQRQQESSPASTSVASSGSNNTRISSDQGGQRQHPAGVAEGLPQQPSSSSSSSKVSPMTAVADLAKSRTSEAVRQLFCGGIAGSVAKTVTAPLSRLTILFQVHSMVTTKEHRPKFAITLGGGFGKMIERGGILSLWKGNMTSVLHRFPYSAINFYVYENAMDVLAHTRHQQQISSRGIRTTTTPVPLREEERNETQRQVVRRLSKIVMYPEDDEEDAYDSTETSSSSRQHKSRTEDTTPAWHKFTAGATAGTVACLACYPLDLVRTRLTTELEGREHYKGIVDAFRKIARQEGLFGFYSGVVPTLFVAVPNFAISYTVYGTLKEYTLDDELFYNLRRIDADSGEPKLGLVLTVICGAASGSLGTMVTFPMDTIRRRMQIQNLHIPESQRLSSRQLLYHLVHKEGLPSLYRGLTPELLKVIPMVSTMFLVYEWSKDLLDVGNARK